MQVGVIGLGQHRRPRRDEPRRRRPRRHRVRRRRRRARLRSTARTRRRSVAEVGAATEITVLSLPTPAVVRQVADEWVTTAAPAGSILVDLSTNSPEVVRELGARLATTGHHLVEAPLTGGAIGAEHRMLVVHGRAATTTPSRGCGRCSSRSAGHRAHLGPLGLGNTMKLVNSLDRVHHHVGEPRGPVARRQVGHPGAAGRRGAPHQRRRQLLPRPHGRGDRRARPARRSSRSSWRRRTPASSSRPARARRADARRRRGAPGARRRDRRRASAITTGATSSPRPSARATSSSSGTPMTALLPDSRHVATHRRTSTDGCADQSGVPRTSAATRSAATAAGTPA